ncbi:protein of unknown function [Pararobbsia alpina]
MTHRHACLYGQYIGEATSGFIFVFRGVDCEVHGGGKAFCDIVRFVGVGG